jgi:hypothetical protein
VQGRRVLLALRRGVGGVSVTFEKIVGAFEAARECAPSALRPKQLT